MVSRRGNKNWISAAVDSRFRNQNWEDFCSKNGWISIQKRNEIRDQKLVRIRSKNGARFGPKMDRNSVQKWSRSPADLAEVGQRTRPKQVNCGKNGTCKWDPLLGCAGARKEGGKERRKEEKKKGRKKKERKKIRRRRRSRRRLSYSVHLECDVNLRRKKIDLGPEGPQIVFYGVRSVNWWRDRPNRSVLVELRRFRNFFPKAFCARFFQKM